MPDRLRRREEETRFQNLRLTLLLVIEVFLIVIALWVASHVFASK